MPRPDVGHYNGMMRTLWTSLLLATAVACSGSSGTPTPDSGVFGLDDGSVPDARLANDASTADAGWPDAQVGQLGEVCGQDADGLTCGGALACCYPCGLPGCNFTCTVACTGDDPSCSNGCQLLP